MSATFTLLDEDRSFEIDAEVSDGAVEFSPDAVRDALGWELKPEGLCRGDVCVPVANRDRINSEGIDLAALAEVLGRPISIDAPHRAAALGASASDRLAQLDSLEAPDFTLPDLSGTLHSLSDYRGKKVLLVAYASW